MYLLKTRLDFPFFRSAQTDEQGQNGRAVLVPEKKPKSRLIIYEICSSRIQLYSDNWSDVSRRATCFDTHMYMGHLQAQVHIIIIYIKDWTSLIRSVSRVTTVLANVSSVFQLFSFLVVCSDMVSTGSSFVAFFANVNASLVCSHLSCLVCL